MSDPPQGQRQKGSVSGSAKSLARLAAAVLTPVLAVVLMATVLNGSGVRRLDRHDAALSCESNVRERLPAPAAARFQRPSAVKVARRGESWAVEGLVTTRDADGRRSSIRYNCVLRASGKNDLRLVGVSLYRYPH